MADDELQSKGWHTQNPTFNSKHMFFYYRLLADKRFMLGDAPGTWAIPRARSKPVPG